MTFTGHQRLSTLKLGCHRQRDVPEQYKRTSHKASELKSGTGRQEKGQILLNLGRKLLRLVDVAKLSVMKLILLTQ